VHCFHFTGDITEILEVKRLECITEKAIMEVALEPRTLLLPPICTSMAWASQLQNTHMLVISPDSLGNFLSFSEMLHNPHYSQGHHSYRV
jgi:hypothetical protein